MQGWGLLNMVQLLMLLSVITIPCHVEDSFEGPARAEEFTTRNRRGVKNGRGSGGQGRDLCGPRPSLPRSPGGGGVGVGRIL